MKNIFRLMFLISLSLFFTACNMRVNSGDPEIGDSAGNEKINSRFSENKTLHIMKETFGKADGKEVFLYTLTNANGVIVKITNYGAIITSIVVPDRDGRLGDIVLGYDSLEQYIDNNPYFGAIAGRFANRIARGTFKLDGKSYQLAINNGNNSLHGGLKGFDKVVWDADDSGDSSSVQVKLKYLSRDSEEGFPGNLKVTVTYSLTDYNELTTLIEAETDQPTPVNLCNHTYFNLSEGNTSILRHILTLFADRFTQVNNELIPTGALPSVKGTSMDFSKPTAIGERIEKVKGGYDHNYVLNKKPGELSIAARMYDPQSGRQVEILTTQPGVQFYSGNFLDGTIRGKSGKVYNQHYGLCLETQHYPDSPNQPAFPNTILRNGEIFSETTIYRFSVIR